MNPEDSGPDDEYQRLSFDFERAFDVHRGRTNGLELTSRETVWSDEEFTAGLINVTSERQSTGTPVKYAIRRKVEDGWKHVLSIPRGYGWPDAGVLLLPRRRQTWTFEATGEGLSQEPYVVREELAPGEYRFVFWGLNGDEAIETRFDLIDG